MFQMVRFQQAVNTAVRGFFAGAMALSATVSLGVAPVLAAPAPPVLAFPAQEITTGSTDITIHGQAPVGGSVVVFVDSDLDGRFHSALDWSWYRKVQSDGTFEVPIFLQKTGAANRDLYAFTDTGAEQSALVKLPVIVHQPGAPVASPQVAVPAPVGVPGLVPAPVVVPAPAPTPNSVFELPPAPAIEPAPAATFNVGDAIEFRANEISEWQPGTILEVRNGSVYIVQYMNVALAKPLETLVFPLDLRAPQGVAAPQVLLPGGELAPGTYACTYDTWSAPPPFGQIQSQHMGSVILFGDGTYTWLDNGEGGAYAYDPATGSITWLSGWFAGGAPESTIFRRNSPTNAQIDITWTGVYDWSCGANL